MMLRGPIDTKRYTMEDVADVVKMFNKGGLVAVPTETVYGLAADAMDGVAVRMLYEKKKRDPDKAVSILVTGMDMVEEYCEDIPQAAYRLAEKYWPGPLTMILKDRGVVSEAVVADEITLGVRCPDHPLTLAILRELGRPLAAPSANISDQPSPKTTKEVLDYFDGRIEGVVEGGTCALGVESTLVDLSGDEPKILREGAIPGQEILDFLKTC